MNLKTISIFLVLATAFAQAIPRFAVKNGTTCSVCHVSPTGGGLRNHYGITIVSMDELPLQRGLKLTDDSYSGDVGDHLRMGADLRLQLFAHSGGTAFFPMQADVYGYFTISRAIHVYTKLDVIRGYPEFWSMLNFMSGYFKIGRKIPTYGLRLDDHTSFIRGGNIRRTHGLPVEGLPFSPLRQLPGILEMGVNFSDLFVTASISNGYVLGKDPGYGSGESISEKNVTVRVEYSKSGSAVAGLAGASVMKEDEFFMRGIFAGLSLGIFALMGEVDLADDWADDGTTSLASYGELAVEPIQGLNFMAKYDFFDEDVDLRDNSLARLTVGMELFPISFIELKAQVRHTHISGSGWEQSAEYLFQVHTWF